MMAALSAMDEDEVEFVSEGPMRPVLEYIDLLSDEENGDSAAHGTVEEQVDREKAKVASTLDRLAHQVEAEKQERAEKCKAVKEKMVSQQAHARQELAFSSSSWESREAKHCVNMWLKMPGPRPGSVHTGFRRRRTAPAPDNGPPASSHRCPVANCGRMFDSALLMGGHLKRFDHSPCDPTITLKGSPSELYICVACSKRFQTNKAYLDHVQAKVSSPQPEGHVISLPPQLIQCFACPCCGLLFNLRDQCLQHMAARNHFSQAITLKGSRTAEKRMDAMPIPIPRYARNRLIALCKEVRFSVRCTSCGRILSSHMEARAHFSVHCKEGGAVAEAAQTVAEVMGQLCAFGRCPPCKLTFLSEAQAEEHWRGTQHRVKVFSTVQESILHYCHHCDTLRNHQGEPSTSAKRSDLPENGHHTGSLAKRQKRDARASWACECGLSFSEEAVARHHFLSANRVFHVCGVCGKQMDEISIARLHMSRFHGGAHLSNFLFRCQRCRVNMPREEDILSHIKETHTGHTFYREQNEPCPVAKPPPEASSRAMTPPTVTSSAKAPSNPVAPPVGVVHKRKWLCRMCEDVFNSEAAVQAHCQDVGAHSFQKFQCGDCGQKFFKMSTLEHHCGQEHSGQVVLRRFCGLCDSMQFDSEEEFLKHYCSLHACDYCCLEEKVGLGETAPSAETPSQSAEPPCPCMASEKSKAEQKVVFTSCMKRLANLGQCSYTCLTCDLRTPYYIQVKEHVQRQHGSQGKQFLVTCGSCPERCVDVPSFHSHYHARHCPLVPCLSQRDNGGSDEGLNDIPKVLQAEEISGETNAEEFDEVKRALALSTEGPRRDMEASSEDCDEDLRRALALSAVEAEKEQELDKEMEEALQRSLLEF